MPDDDDGNDNPVANAAVSVVVQRAEGLPLYVHFVVEDIRGGHFRFDELAQPGRLPDGLNQYYDDLLRRLSIGALQALLTPLVVTIDWAEAPLDIETLHLLMTRCGEKNGTTFKRCQVNILNLSSSQNLD